MVGKPEGRRPLGVSRVNITQQAVVLTLDTIIKTLNATSGLHFTFSISNVLFMLSAYCERCEICLISNDSQVSSTLMPLVNPLIQIRFFKSCVLLYFNTF